jgi:hypothetical protein
MTKDNRFIPLALAALIAVFSAVVALSFSGGHGADAHAAMTDRHGTITTSELTLRSNMRSLWEDHVTWTRLAVISLTAGLPDTKATVARLLRNQADIGNAVKPFYGAAAGSKLTALLHEHILIAADLIAAAKKGDQGAVKQQQARWTANADKLAAFLSSANPRFWKLGEMKGMLYKHLGLTTAEVLDRLNHRWGADVRDADRIRAQALEMADMLSAGIVGQFSSRFA